MGNLYRFVEPLILYLLKIKGKSHGYDLVSALNEHALTDSVIEPGALYRTLRRLELNQYVVSSWDVTGAGPARRFYELTPAGNKHFIEWVEVLEHLSKSMSKFVNEAQDVLKS
jgi:DNA-binding PadR family transcriptional regulator